MLQEHLEPKSTAEATHREVKILDVSYEKADMRSIVNECCKHLTTDQCNKLLLLKSLMLCVDVMSYINVFDVPWALSIKLLIV